MLKEFNLWTVTVLNISHIFLLKMNLIKCTHGEMNDSVCTYAGWGKAVSTQSTGFILILFINDCAISPMKIVNLLLQYLICVYKVHIGLWLIEFSVFAHSKSILFLFFSGYYNRCYPLPVCFHGYSLQTLSVPQSVLGSFFTLLSNTTTDHILWTQKSASLLILDFL